MKVVDIADEIFRELGEPTSLSIPAISFWLRTNVGQLNNYIHTEYLFLPIKYSIITQIYTQIYTQTYTQTYPL